MKKLTKKQWKDRERILAWLAGQPFKENSRAKPAIPELTREDVIEQYVPPDVTGAGQYFTPLEMAKELIQYAPVKPDTWVLDPCAGTGNLFWPLRHHLNRCDVVAFEMEQECVQIGARLYPEVNWHWAIPFDYLSQIEGKFDYVLMNPPYGTTRGIYPGQDMAEGRCTKSEHCFLELAVRALKPGGTAYVLGPYNYIERLPKAARRWFDERAEVFGTRGPLPGEFRMTSFKLHAWYIQRKPEPKKQVAPDMGLLEWARATAPAAAVGNPGEPVQLSLWGG